MDGNKDGNARAVRLNKATTDADIDLDCLRGELEGVFEDTEIQTDCIAGMVIHARRLGRLDDGSYTHTVDYAVRGADDLLAGALARLFEERPHLHERTEAILNWRKVTEHDAKRREGRS